MSSKYKLILYLNTGIFCLLVLTVLCISCCKHSIPTKVLVDLHNATSKNDNVIDFSDNLALYVDYSTCIARGMDSEFYQKMVSPLSSDAVKEYYSIKGIVITKENISDSTVYARLNNINEINYAALDDAILQMASRNAESVMLTDGELFTQTVTKNNPNNPYMHKAFKKWLSKGHDIHIIAEPYVESYSGQQFEKKRFYIIFTDDRIEGNIYKRICKLINLSDFRDLDLYHLSGNYGWKLPQDGLSSKPDQYLVATILPEPNQSYEIQEWITDWKDIIDYFVSNAVDDNGNPLKNGRPFIKGLKLDKNTFGCYRIKSLNIKAYQLTQEVDSIYTMLNNGSKIGKLDFSFEEIPSFIQLDSNEFKNHSNIDLLFNKNLAIDGNQVLNGDPNAFFKIEISIADLENIADNNINIFDFASIVNPGKTNVSISESVRNCAFDNDLKNAIIGKVLYTIYVKSPKYPG